MKKELQNKDKGLGFLRHWKVMTMTLLLLTFSIGQMWAADITVTPPTPNNASNPFSAGLYVMSFSGEGSKLSSGAITTGTKSAVITITFQTTKSDMYIKTINFNSLGNGTLSSEDGTFDEQVFTATGNKNSVNIVLTSTTNQKGTVKVSSVVVNTGTNTVETITFTGVDGSNATFTSSATTSALSSISSNGTFSVSSGILTWPNSKTMVLTAESNIKYAAFIVNDGKMYDNFSAAEDTYNTANYSWSGSSKTVTFTNGTGGGRTIKQLYVIIQPVVKHHVTYALGTGASGTTPTQTDVAEGAKFTLHNGTTGITPPTGKQFAGWSDGTSTYAASAEYTMGTSDVTLTAQWENAKTDPTATFSAGAYVVGASALDLSGLWSSNSDGAVTYALKEASDDATVSTTSFTATKAGSYVVTASQAATATYNAIVKEATITVTWPATGDATVTYEVKVGTSQTTLDTNKKEANSASISNFVGFTTAGDLEVQSGGGKTASSPKIATPTAKNDAQYVYVSFDVASGKIFTISSVTTKIVAVSHKCSLEVVLSDGVTTESLKYEQATNSDPGSDHEFEFAGKAYEGTVTLKIYAYGDEATSYRIGKPLTIEGTVAVKPSPSAPSISAPTADSEAEYDLNEVITPLSITASGYPTPTYQWYSNSSASTEGATAIEGAQSASYTPANNVASNLYYYCVATNSQGSATSHYFHVTVNAPAVPTIYTETTALTLTSTKIATDSKNFTFSGANLGTTPVTLVLASAVDGITLSESSVTPTAGAITDKEITVSYKSLVDVAEADVNLYLKQGEDILKTIVLTYSSTAGIEDLTSISAATTWNWDGAADAAYGTLGQNDMIVLANADVTWDAGFNANAIAGKLQHYYRDGKYAQGLELKFNTTVAGKVYVKFSNTSTKTVARAPRITDVNGSYAPTDEADGSKTSTAIPYNHLVAAGDILIAGFEMQEGTPANMLRYYEVKFLPTHTLSFADAGEVEPMTVAETEKAILPEPATIPSGNSFIGWYIGEDKVGDAGDEYTMGTANVELTAKFSAPAETPTITKDLPLYVVAYCAGSEPTLSITAEVSDGGTLHYAWYKKGEADTKVGSDAASYTVESAGTYYVIVTNQKTGSADASVTSENAVVTMNTGAEITAQPAAMQVVDAGDAVTLSVTATNATGYQWYKGGVLIEGADAATYNFTAATGVATYYCVVTGACGTVQSNSAVVYVESGDCNTAGYGDGADNVFGTKGSEIALGTYVTYKYSKSPSDFNILVGETPTGVKAHKMDGEFYVWTTNTELVAITTSVLTNGTVGGKYCVVFYDVAGYQPDASHIISVVELTAGLKDAAQTFDVTPAPAGAKCARLVREVEWNEVSYGESSQTFIYAFRACAIVPAEKPVIATEPADLAVCALGTNALSVTVNAVSDGGTLSYQWYNADGDVVIAGAEAASYTPTAEGTYYVIVTNTKAGCPSSSTKSANATVSVKLATAITAYANATGTVGANKTLSVTAEGAGTLTYQWQACDENGNVTDPAVLGTETTYAVTITAEPQYYLVTVHGDCGDQTQVLYAKEWSEVELQDVTGSMTWNWKVSENTVWSGVENIDVASTMVLANAGLGAMPNSDNFRSDMLKAIVDGVQTRVRPGQDGGCYQGNGIMFHTTVPGIVRVTYRGTGNSEDVTLTIGSETLETYHGAFTTSKKVFVPAGDVVISSGTNAMRVQKIQFIAEADYTRPVTEGRYGTICLPNGGVMVGAALFEVAYHDATLEKIFFDEVLNGVMEAGVPYIFLPNNGVSALGVYYTDDASAPAGNYHGLYGSYTQEVLAQEAGNYILYNNQYMYVGASSSNVSVGANRAYFKIGVEGGIPTNAVAPLPGRRRVSMSAVRETPTGLENGELINGENGVQKVLINGELFILRGEKMYDATGRLVK